MAKYLGMGANLPHPEHGAPVKTFQAALQILKGQGVEVTAQSRWYSSAPVPPSDQPWFVNGVVAVATGLAPADLLALLHRVEDSFGRVRSEPNAPRLLDLDLLDYDSLVSGAGETPILPHPRLDARAFVLLPLRELAPGWRHPRSGTEIDRLIEALPPEQVASPMDP